MVLAHVVPTDDTVGQDVDWPDEQLVLELVVGEQVVPGDVQLEVELLDVVLLDGVVYGAVQILFAHVEDIPVVVGQLVL